MGYGRCPDSRHSHLTKEGRIQRMAKETLRGQNPKFERRIVPWLLGSDPSIRWQVMRDLTEEPDELVTAERSRVASEGWGARLLAFQGPDGKWGVGTSAPGTVGQRSRRRVLYGCERRPCRRWT